MKQHPVPTGYPSLPTPPFTLPLALSPILFSVSFPLSVSLSHSFSFIRSLNVANKNNTTSMWRGDVRGLRRIIKITLPTNPLPPLSLSLFDRTIAGSLARAVDADVADVLSFWSCEKFETHLTLFSSSSLIFLLSLSVPLFFLPFFLVCLSSGILLGVAVVRIQATMYVAMYA